MSWQGIPRGLPNRWPLQHPEAVLFVNLYPCQWAHLVSCTPAFVQQLMEYCHGFGATRRTNAKLPHGRHDSGCVTRVQLVQSPAHPFAQKLAHLDRADIRACWRSIVGRRSGLSISIRSTGLDLGSNFHNVGLRCILRQLVLSIRPT
jgi:hypothetical protein